MRRCVFCEDEIHTEDEDAEYQCEECGEIFTACWSCNDNYNWEECICTDCRGM